MIPSVLINAVLALDVLLLGAAQGLAPARSLAGIKTASCEFTLHAVSNWKDGEPQAGVTPAKLSFRFEDINTDEGSARIVGPFGPSDIVVRLSRDTLHFLQSFREGPLYVTTVIPRIARDGRVMAVHTRHEYTDVALSGYNRDVPGGHVWRRSETPEWRWFPLARSRDARRGRASRLPVASPKPAFACHHDGSTTAVVRCHSISLVAMA